MVTIMAKASSPLRLQSELMQAAASTARRFHRSTAEQIEYWADIGRKTSEVIDPDTLLSLVSGLIRLKVEPVDNVVLDPESIFRAMEDERDAGTLGESMSCNKVKYQVSISHPGYLERVDAEGIAKIGRFIDGKFSSLRANID